MPNVNRLAEEIIHVPLNGVLDTGAHTAYLYYSSF